MVLALTTEIDPRLLMTHEAFVVDNADPLGLHRVRVAIPGFLEPKSAWARPKTFGGGSPQRGGHIAPPVGAIVAVGFFGANPEAPFYDGGSWRLPDEGGTAPSDMLAAGAEAHLVQPIVELRDWRITADEREGKRRLTVASTSEKYEMYLNFDGETGLLTISADTGILLQSDGSIAIRANQIRLNDRLVNAGTSKTI